MKQASRAVTFPVLMMLALIAGLTASACTASLPGRIALPDGLRLPGTANSPTPTPTKTPTVTPRPSATPTSTPAPTPTFDNDQFDAAVDELIMWAGSGARALAYGGLGDIEEVHDPRLASLLMQKFATRERTPEGDRRAAGCIRVLAKFKVVEAVPALLDAFDEADDYERPYAPDIALSLGEFADPRVIPALIRALGYIRVHSESYSVFDYYPELTFAIGQALDKIPGGRVAATPLLLEMLREGNPFAAAQWLFTGEPSVTKQAVAAMLHAVQAKPERARNFKRELFPSLAGETRARILAALDGSDRALFAALLVTNQPIESGWTDDELEWAVEGSDLQERTAELFDRTDVRDALARLDAVDPETLRAFMWPIAYVNAVSCFGLDGQETWATTSAKQDLVEPLRIHELASHSVLAKLLVQHGDLAVPSKASAVFRWSGKPTIEVPLSAIEWTQDDIPTLTRLSTGQNAYYRKAASEALERINNNERALVKP